MSYNFSLHPQLKLVNKFGNLNSIKNVKPSNRPHIYGGMFLARQIMFYEQKWDINR